MSEVSTKNTKRTIASAVLLVIASLFVAFGVAEISFPESFLTFTDQDWLLDIWPKAYRYNIHVGVAACIICGLLIIPAYKLQKDFAVRALEMLCRIGIGGMFIFASIFKIQDPHQFATLVAQYLSPPSSRSRTRTSLRPSSLSTSFSRHCT